MKIDRIPRTLAAEQRDDILIGGVNFLLRHEPELTCDVDIWLADCDGFRVDDLKQRQEAKWERAFDPVQRWLAIQEMITSAEANKPAHWRRNCPRAHPGERKREI